MIYPYKCDTCDIDFEIIKPAADSSKPEHCEKCQGVARRVFTRFYFNGASDWGKAEFNPGLGQVVKNKKERDEIAKRKGLIEIGNEPPESIHKEMEKVRAERSKYPDL